MKLKACIAMLAVCVASMSYGEVSVFYSYQDTKDIGSGSGVGLKIDIPVADNVSLDVRGSWMTGYDVKTEKNGGAFSSDLDLVPVEANLNLALPVIAGVAPYVGAGVSYNFFFDNDTLDSDWGYNAHVGASLGLSDGLALFAEVKYLWSEVDGKSGILGAGSDYKAKLDGVGVIVGLTFSL
ncbi:MAG: outer membrane beta-barrel protein [Kiritimatiellae bacterium]|nr:outer membrane beta-barrel protein [Kiritimatiellia bacterium]